MNDVLSDLRLAEIYLDDITHRNSFEYTSKSKIKTKFKKNTYFAKEIKLVTSLETDTQNWTLMKLKQS